MKALGITSLVFFGLAVASASFASMDGDAAKSKRDKAATTTTAGDLSTQTVEKSDAAPVVKRRPPRPEGRLENSH